jgi:gliding motility-associated-like protein
LHTVKTLHKRLDTRFIEWITYLVTNVIPFERLFNSLNEIKSSLLYCILALFVCIPVNAQKSNCENLDFELGNFTNWEGYTWRYSTNVPSINTSPQKGLVNRRHAIMSDTSVYDANTGNKLRKIPPGYMFSARLGDEIISSDGKPRCWEQSLRYTMTIDSTNALLVIKFALVLQYADDHTMISEPRFRFTLFDQKGDTLPDCSNYDVYSSNRNVKGFQSYMPEGAEDPVEWRDWTTVGANLLKYLGQTITIEFMTADCTMQYHYGYAYFIAECHPLYITLHYCAGDSIASLEAPVGFEKYSWTDGSEEIIDTMQIFHVADPAEGAVYTCTMTSATGCTVSLQSTIAKYDLKAGFSSYMIDCNSNTVQFINSSSTTKGTLLYSWDFGDGNTSSERNPQYTFVTSGMHQVSLCLINPPSTCVDTLIKEVESFSPPLVGIDGDSTYCPGQSVWLKAYGAYDYTWSDGSKKDSLEVRVPGGAFWLIGRSSTGCVSDTIPVTVSEEPDWLFSAEGDTVLCKGDSLLLSAYGAASYYWNTGDTASSIVIQTPGNYSVVGTNKRGCPKSESFEVAEYPLPEAGFSMSESTLDSRHNRLTCNVSEQPGASYVWDMGDGSTETGPEVQHTYNISNSRLAYTITLTVTSPQGCMNTSSEIIDIVPFVPNVFTPNGDGINDVFMPGLDLEIFDRNGLLLFKGKDGWDGRYKGHMANSDTYFYLIYYLDRNQITHTKKGFVTLVK